MNLHLHKNARTTHLIRAELKASIQPRKALAEQYNLSVGTVDKWRSRESVEDKSHRPNNLQTTLSKEQEALVVELRTTLLLPLDDLVSVTREFIHPEASRSGIDRCLSRHGVGNLRKLKAELEPQDKSGKAHKPFKSYPPGFLHVDVKYLPKMPDKPKREYLFVAIDRATRWVYAEVLANKSATSAKRFFKRVVAAAPFVVTKVLTDNGKEFTDRYCATGEREPTGKHQFDTVCSDNAIEHRLIPPRRPQTNGMVERFNGRISEVLSSQRFESSANMEAILNQYVSVYNHSIPQKSLGHISPIKSLKQWHDKRPDLFKKRVYNHPGLDTYSLL